ncbi:MAG TPA: heterodisulfide reductase-related iron-sulfur binding cluster [Tepidisphaeraceae bacterium]|jgi:glycolate oxidase iron-sulfur subunit
MHTTPDAPRETSPSEPALRLDPRTFDRGLSCVHCGLCLPACPTFTQTGHEADSPRGRIQLMLGLATGQIQPTESVRHHLDLCLDCRGCETACPSAVQYHELIEETRSKLAESAPLRGHRRLMRAIFYNIFVYPTRLKLALLPARVLQRLGIYALLRKSGIFSILPAGLRKMEQMLPPEGRLWPRSLPERTPPRDTGFQPVQTNPSESKMPQVDHSKHGLEARVTGKATIGFFAGCIGSVMFDEVNRKAVELLAACGATVIAPKLQNCCGAIHHHSGSNAPAAAFARQNIEAFFPKDGPAVDYIATNIAGCGAMLREYDHLLRDDPKYAERAKQFASRVRDITEVLLLLGLPELKHSVNQTATYHDACHLAHAQKVTAAPRKLLAQVPGLKLIPLPDSDMCCGAAGTYNLEQPEMSGMLAERKLNNINSTGAAICITGNVGCAMQIQSEAGSRGQTLRVLHPVEVLHFAAFGK